MDKSVLDTILQTWSKMDIPPNPSKKAVNIILVDIFFVSILEILFIPFVISNIPNKRGSIKEISILKKLNIGTKSKEEYFIILVEDRIAVIIENTTIKPPIKKIVEIEFVILLLNTSPKFDRWIVLFVVFM